MKKPAVILVLPLLLLLLVPLVPGREEAFEAGWETEDEFEVLSLRDEDLCPEDPVYGLYSAPFEDAFRPEGGGPGAGETVTLLGTAQRGAWSMIEYGLPGGAKRIAWAHIPGVEPEVRDTFPCENRPCRLTRDADLTDDPNGRAEAVLRLHRGDTVTALGAVGFPEPMGCGSAGALAESPGTPRWIYVQTLLSGRTAWLFVREDALLPERLWSLDEDGVLTVREGVTRIGDPYMGTVPDGTGGYTPRFFPLTKDAVSVSSLSAGWTIPEGVRAIVFPSSLEALGYGAVSGGEYDYLFFPRIPDLSSFDPLDFVRTEKLVLGPEAGDIGTLADGLYFFIGGFEVSEGNPYYTSDDGVLFSADGKSLIKYPNARKDEHYTVPAGTKEIADRAFDYGGANICLRTVSLPIGLERIGEHAFSGCGRLLSLAVPLTVTELGENAFTYCVSLERLSLPPGLTAVTEASPHILYGDFSIYNGDNGTTLPRPTADPYHEIYKQYMEEQPEEEEDPGVGALPRFPEEGLPAEKYL